MQHTEIIEHLGGPYVIARKLRMAPSTVWRWKSKGIPLGYWPRIQRLGKAKGLRLSLEKIALGSPVIRAKETTSRAA